MRSLFANVTVFALHMYVDSNHHSCKCKRVELLLYMVRFVTRYVFDLLYMFEESSCVWFTVRLFPARSKAVMLNDTTPSACLHLHYTCTTVSVILIAYVAFRSVTFALERSSFAVIVMFSSITCNCIIGSRIIAVYG